jgi:hypothetical protein
MIMFALLVLMGIISIAAISNDVYMVTAQSLTENTSNLTNPNNPTLKLDEAYNRTSELDNNSTESDQNLPSPM